ncbi:uncharacterized protein LOC117084926 [Trachypithecus francoisi]|uniref:uncharacterized protein LOC117084926 n=1 Tax=Trachypithecus francoisi TaxID=54180 RepID=UPI00141BA1C0|nr:uncharacterized protein LOC117084926 [Trachypithecus francoisi]
MKEKAAAAVIDTTLIDALTPPLRVRVGSQVRDVVGAVQERHPPPAAPFTRMLEFGSKLVLYQHFLLHRAPSPQLCVGGEAPTPHKNRVAGEKRRPRCPRGKRSPVKLGSGQQSQRSDPHSHQKTPPPRRFCCQLESATDSPRTSRKRREGGEGNGSLCPRGASASSCRLLKTNKLNPPPSGVSGNSWDREKVVHKSGRLRTSGFRGAGARWRPQLGAASRGSSERGPPPLPPSCGFPRAGPVQAEPRVPASLGGGPGRGCPEGRLLQRPAGKGRNPPRSPGRPSASWEARVHVLRLPKREWNHAGRRAHGNQEREAGTREPNEPDRARPRALVTRLLSATGTRAPTHGECLEWSWNGGPFV